MPNSPAAFSIVSFSPSCPSCTYRILNTPLLPNLSVCMSGREQGDPEIKTALFSGRVWSHSYMGLPGFETLPAHVCPVAPKAPLERDVEGEADRSAIWGRVLAGRRLALAFSFLALRLAFALSLYFAAEPLCPILLLRFPVSVRGLAIRPSPLAHQHWFREVLHSS